MDYFEVFGLPRQLGIDTLALEKKFYELSRKYHPDYFTTASPSEKTQAVRMTALLNDAYRTLRHPVHRVEYLLSLYGFKPDSSKVPQALLIEVFEINELAAPTHRESAPTCRGAQVQVTQKSRKRGSDPLVEIAPIEQRASRDR